MKMNFKCAGTHLAIILCSADIFSVFIVSAVYLSFVVHCTSYICNCVMVYSLVIFFFMVKFKSLSQRYPIFTVYSLDGM